MESAFSFVPAHEGLADFLTHEHFLRPVLLHLIDHGLHECRLVCRMWNDVVKTLPVKLLDVPRNQRSQLGQVFPEAGSLARVRGFVELQDLVDLLRQLPELKTIELYHFHLAPSPELEASRSILERLESLAIRLLGLSSVFAENFIHVLPLCTNLTRLEMNFCHASFRLNVLAAEKFHTLKKIQDLCAPMLFLDDNGRYMFPSLTNLKRVRIAEDSDLFMKFPGGALEVGHQRRWLVCMIV